VDTTVKSTIPEIYIVLWPIVLSVLTFAIGVIVTLFKVLRDQDNKKQAEQDQAIKELQNAIIELPEKYVLKEDFTRIVTQIQKEVKDIGDKIICLNNTVIAALNDLSVKIAKLPGGEDS
jgi:uncharacterized UPF0160 family protein